MKKLQESVSVMKILCNPHRYAIMQLLLTSKEEFCVNEIAEATGISQSLASHQLSYLQARDLIVGHRHGQTICYMPSRSPLLGKVAKVIKTLS